MNDKEAGDAKRAYETEDSFEIRRPDKLLTQDYSKPLTSQYTESLDEYKIDRLRPTMSKKMKQQALEQLLNDLRQSILAQEYTNFVQVFDSTLAEHMVSSDQHPSSPETNNKNKLGILEQIFQYQDKQSGKNILDWCQSVFEQRQDGRFFRYILWRVPKVNECLRLGGFLMEVNTQQNQAQINSTFFQSEPSFEELNITNAVLSGNLKTLDHLSPATFGETADWMNFIHLQHLKTIHSEMKKSKVNLIFTQAQTDSDCQRSSLLQIAVKTLKVTITLDLQEYRPKLKNEIIKCLNKIFFENSDPGTYNIKMVGDEDPQVKKGTYTQSYMIFGVNEFTTTKEEYTERIKSQIELINNVKIQNIIVEDERSFRISINDIKVKTQTIKADQSTTQGWIRKKIALNNECQQSIQNPPSTDIRGPGQKWVNAFVAISSNMEKVRQIQQNGFTHSNQAKKEEQKRSDILVENPYAKLDGAEFDNIDAVFLYGAFRPDDLGSRQWVREHLYGINGQKAVLRRAKLFDTGYNPALLIAQTIQENRKVYGWVMQHKNPKIFRKFLKFQRDPNNIGLYFPNDQSVAYYQQQIVEVELRDTSFFIGDLIGKNQEKIKCLVLHHSEQNMTFTELTDGDWLKRDLSKPSGKDSKSKLNDLVQNTGTSDEQSLLQIAQVNGYDVLAQGVKAYQEQKLEEEARRNKLNEEQLHKIRNVTRLLNILRRHLKESYEDKLKNILRDIDLKSQLDQAHRILCSPSFNVIRQIAESDNADIPSCQLFLQCKINPETLIKNESIWTIDSYKDVKPIAFLLRNDNQKEKDVDINKQFNPQIQRFAESKVSSPLNILQSENLDTLTMGQQNLVSSNTFQNTTSSPTQQPTTPKGNQIPVPKLDIGTQIDHQTSPQMDKRPTLAMASQNNPTEYMKTHQSQTELSLSDRDYPSVQDFTKNLHQEFLEQLKQKTNAVEEEEDYNFYDSSDDEGSTNGKQDEQKDQLKNIEAQIDYIPQKDKQTAVNNIKPVKSPQIYNISNRMHNINQGTPQINFKTLDRQVDLPVPESYKERMKRKSQIQQKFWQLTQSKHQESKYENKGQSKTIQVKGLQQSFDQTLALKLDSYLTAQPQQQIVNTQIPSKHFQNKSFDTSKGLHFMANSRNESESFSISNLNGTVRKMNMTINPIQRRKVLNTVVGFDFDKNLDKFRTRILKDSQANNKKLQAKSTGMQKKSVYDVIDMFMDKIDFKKELQIFNTINAKPKDSMAIRKVKLLGEGGQGFVYLVNIDGSEELLYADKAFTILQNKKEADKCLQAQLQEFCIGQDLRHPNIIEYLYFMRTLNKRSQTHQFHLIMEHIDGSDLHGFLVDRMKRKENVELWEIKLIGGQLISALHYLHKRLIVHLDIKPANIMMTQDKQNIKLIDFGVSQILEVPWHAQKIALAGTYRYMPPEQHDESASLRSDIWSYACVLFELSTGLRPFEGINEYAMCYKVAQGFNPLDYALQNESQRKLKLINDNPELKTILKCCFEEDHMKRPSAADLYNHNFFRGFTFGDTSTTLKFRSQIGKVTQSSNLGSISNNQSMLSDSQPQSVEQSNQKVNIDSSFFFKRRTMNLIHEKFLQGHIQNGTNHTVQSLRAPDLIAKSPKLSTNAYKPNKNVFRKSHDLGIIRSANTTQSAQIKDRDQLTDYFTLLGTSQNIGVPAQWNNKRRLGTQIPGKRIGQKQTQPISSSEFTFEMSQLPNDQHYLTQTMPIAGQTYGQMNYASENNIATAGSPLKKSFSNFNNAKGISRKELKPSGATLRLNTDITEVYNQSHTGTVTGSISKNGRMPLTSQIRGKLRQYQKRYTVQRKDNNVNLKNDSQETSQSFFYGITAARMHPRMHPMEQPRQHAARTQYSSQNRFVGQRSLRVSHQGTQSMTPLDDRLS